MKLFAQKEAGDFVKTGAKEFRYNRDIRLTPGAKDVLIEAGIKIVFDAGASAPAASSSGSSSSAAPAAAGAKLTAQQLFNSPQAQKIKEDICEMGKRCWQRDYNDANGGNISPISSRNTVPSSACSSSPRFCWRASVNAPRS